MKKLYLVNLLFFLLANCFGNAGVFRGSGQTPTLEKTEDVQMVEEEIIMTPRESKYPVDTSARNLDKMDFQCRFILRNLSNKQVVLQVGFPLDSEALRYTKKEDIDTAKIIAQYNFSAKAKNKKFPIRFVPWDREKKFSQLFLWDMTFEPNEDIELLVNYTMEGYMGMATTIRNRDWRNRKQYNCEYLQCLTTGIGQSQFYVTETGSSWAGEIEKAVFRYYPYEFEGYLAKRGAWEESKKKRQERLEKFAKNLNRREYLLSPDMPMIREWKPEFKMWQVKQGKNKQDNCLELVYQPYKPQKKDNIQIGYIFVAMPQNIEQFENYCLSIKTNLEKFAKAIEAAKTKNPQQYEKFLKDSKIIEYDSSVRKNVADVVLEFYGIARNNAEIADFLADQVWYPVENAPQIAEDYKQFLLEISEAQ